MSLSPARAAALLADNVQRVIQGKPDVVRLAIVALFAEGHLLIEDVPGLGKTSLAPRSPAASAARGAASSSPRTCCPATSPAS